MLWTVCYQVIQLSDKYNNVQKKDAPEPKTMQIKNSKGFILDSKGYNFTPIRSMNKGKNPDLIFIVAKAGKYKIPINLNGPTLIDKNTMISLEGLGKNFSGFEKDDTPIIAIGTMLPGDDIHTQAYWVSMIQLVQ